MDKNGIPLSAYLFFSRTGEKKRKNCSLLTGSGGRGADIWAVLIRGRWELRSEVGDKSLGRGIGDHGGSRGRKLLVFVLLLLLLLLLFMEVVDYLSIRLWETGIIGIEYCFSRKVTRSILAHEKESHRAGFGDCPG